MTHTGSTHHIWQRSAAQRCCPGGHADTMSEWGLIVMSSVMALFAFGMRRRLPF